MNINYKVDYLKNSDNGQALADIQRDLQGQIDGLKIKTLTYTGTGSSTNTITFPEVPTFVLHITNLIADTRGFISSTSPILWGVPVLNINFVGPQTNTSSARVSYADNTMTISGGDEGLAMNATAEYTVYYI